MSAWESQTPQWLRKLERRFQWIAIPNIAVIFVTLQALGTLMVMSNPLWESQLALIPEAVRMGQFWRLITFLALPISVGNLIWVIFALWFLYFVLNMIESEWGAFKTTLYTLVSILVTIAFSFAFDYPVTSIEHFQYSLFFAAAALFPDTEVSLFLIIPVKIKWLAWLTGAFVLFGFVRGDWLDRLFLISIYSNFLIFFGPAVLSRLKQHWRRKRFERSFRD
jgi:membrane associated rhomboid family serine protease